MDAEDIAKFIGIKNGVTVVEDFLPQSEFDQLKNFMMGPDVEWYRNEGVNVLNDGNRQFTHVFYDSFYRYSVSFGRTFPILEKLNPIALFRVKANLNPVADRVTEFGYHVDYHQPCATAVYYINTNNGYTKFESGEMVESKENRLVIFPSFMKHTGTTCSDGNDRVVINVNFIPTKKFW